MRKRVILVLLLLSILIMNACLEEDTNSQKDVSSEIRQDENTIENKPDIDNRQDIVADDSTIEGIIDVTEQNEADNTTTIYEGCYFDERVYQYVDIPDYESPLIYYEIWISNVTNTSLNFEIYEIVMATGEKTLMVPVNMAVIEENGYTATYKGDNMELSLIFSDDLSFPKFMEIVGLEQMEGKKYLNNSIPGHESG